LEVHVFIVDSDASGPSSALIINSTLRVHKILEWPNLTTNYNLYKPKILHGNNFMIIVALYYEYQGLFFHKGFNIYDIWSSGYISKVTSANRVSLKVCQILLSNF
jgi:hypothetical protein